MVEENEHLLEIRSFMQAWCSDHGQDLAVVVVPKESGVGSGENPTILTSLGQESIPVLMRRAQVMTCAVLADSIEDFREFVLGTTDIGDREAMEAITEVMSRVLGLDSEAVKTHGARKIPGTSLSVLDGGEASSDAPPSTSEGTTLDGGLTEDS